MNKELYFDNAATTAVDERVVEAMKPYFSMTYGNPGSMHTLGLEAKEALDSARVMLARFLNCSDEEVIFTGSGTESINMAIKGAALALQKKGKHIITQKTEHPAVLETCEYLEKQGFEVTYLDVDVYGFVSLEKLKEVMRLDTILVSIMYANNEIGTVQPIKEIAEVCKENKVLFHTDACQAAGYLDMDVKNLGIDYLSMNGSKLYGPKGVGILYVKSGRPLSPLIHGGGQEYGKRSGTENVPLIVGLAKAVEIADGEREREVARLTEMRDYLIRELLKRIPKSLLNGHPTKRLPNNVNVTFLNVEGETLLLELDQYGICASTGSACTSKTLEPSHVILALGRPYEVAHGSLRFSLGRYTTKEGIDKLLGILPETVEKYRMLSPVHLQESQI